MVKEVRDNSGRFPMRPHYEANELDQACERLISQFLKSKYGMVSFPITTDDLTVFIEEHVESLDLYADLSAMYGEDVEGVTEFRPNRRPLVRVSEKLSSQTNMENRLRTTLAHEFGHVHFHGYLWTQKFEAGNLFNARTDQVVNKRDAHLKVSKADWMEWQAGYVCGALLMPKSHVGKLVSPLRNEAGVYGPVYEGDPLAQEMISLVSTGFTTSQEAARVRLSVLNFITNVQSTQQSLAF